MPYAPPNVYYASVFDGTYTKLDGVQSVSIKRGKTRFQDPTPGSQCVIELIPQATYPAAIALGQYIDIRDENNGLSPAYFAGQITDIDRSYSIPYDAGTGLAPEDRVVITVTGGTGVLASGYGSSGYGYPAGVDATYQLIIGSMSVAQVYGINAANQGWVYPNIPKPIGQEVLAPNIAPWLDNINKVLNTIQYSVDDYDLLRQFKYNGAFYTVSAGVFFYPTGQTEKTLTFTDDGSTGTDTYKFQQIDYESSVQSAFTQVLVESSLATQDVKSGEPPYIGFSYRTAAVTISQATDLGNYILTTNASKTPTPFLIGTSTAAQDNVGNLGKLDLTRLGSAVIVKFRGTTVNATVCGITANYYSDYASVSFNLTPSLGTPFILDSIAFGILGGTGITYNTPMDYNEAGYIYNDNYADNGNRLGYP